MSAVTVNAAWPAANEMAAGATPVTRIAGGRSTHSTVVFVPTASTITAPTTMPTTVPSTARSDALARAQRVRAQHRKRPEHDPEPVLRRRTTSATSTAAASAGRAPEAVVQPGRVTIQVRRHPLARHCEQVGDARSAPARGADPASCVVRPPPRSPRWRRSARRRSSPPARGSTGPARTRCGEAPLRIANASSASSASREPRDGVVQVVSRSLRSVQQPRAAVEHRRGGVLDRPGGGHARARARSPRATRSSHCSSSTIRRIARSAVPRPAGRNGVAKNARRMSLDGAVRVLPPAPAQTVRQPPARADDRVPEGVRAPARATGASSRAARRPRRCPTRRAARPARTRCPRVTGRMNASSSDVVAPASTELTTAENRTANPTIAIETHRQPHGPRHQRSDARRAPRPTTASADLRLEPPAHRAGEVDQQQHRERAEGGEDRHDRVADDLLADRERGGHGDRRARRHGAAPPGRGRACRSHSSGRRSRPPMARSSPPGGERPNRPRAGRPSARARTAGAGPSCPGSARGGSAPCGARRRSSRRSACPSGPGRRGAGPRAPWP